MEGAILDTPGIFTGVALMFLRTMSLYDCGAGVQTVGLGDWKTDPRAADAVQTALRRARQIVANLKENMKLKLRRLEHSWFHAFTPFRLPSPLSTTDAGAAEAATEAESCLRRICREARLSE